MIFSGWSKVDVRYVFPAFIYLLFSCAQVLAHAELQEIYPANLDVFDESPEEFYARYNEPVSPARILLLDQNGEEVALGDIRTENNIVRFSSVFPLSDGQYILSVRVISLDAHPVASSIGFSVGNLSPPVPKVSEADSTIRLLFRVIQVIHLPVVLLCIGLIFYPFLFSMSRTLETRRLRVLTGLCIAGLVTTLLNLGIGGVMITGDGILGLLNIDAWQQASATTLGTRYGILAGGLTGVLLSILLGQDISTGRYLELFGVLLMVFSFGASGHAASSGLIFKPVFVIHALIAGIWLGAIAALYAMLETENIRNFKSILIDFSDMARYLVGVLLICALILVWHQVESLSALVATEYGLLLLLKIFLVILALALAVANRWYFTPALEESNPASASGLKRSIAIESLVLFLIVVVTTVLVSISPDKTFDDNGSWSVTLTNQSELVTDLVITPARTGNNSLEMVFSMGEGRSEPEQVEVQWLQENAGVEPVTVIARKTDAGVYRVNDMNFLIPGEWTIRVNVLIDDFTRERFITHLEIK